MIRALLLLLLSGLAVAACNNASGPTGEQPTMGSVRSAPVQGSVAGANLLPADWPIPLHSSVTKIEGADSNSEPASFIVFHDAPVSVVASYYRQEFMQRGWKVQDLANTPLAPVVFSAIGPQSTARCYFSPEGARSNVRVSVSAKSGQAATSHGND